MLRPVVPLIANPPQMVSKLIDETSVTWKEDLIRSCCVPMDATAILSIYPSVREGNLTSGLGTLT
jgi:hypothetical protein